MLTRLSSLAMQAEKLVAEIRAGLDEYDQRKTGDLADFTESAQDVLLTLRLRLEELELDSSG